MIAKIQHISTYDSLRFKIEYNENKIEKGSGVMLIDSTFSDSKEDRFNSLRDIISSNKNVRSNLAFEVSLNLPPGENLKDEDFRNLVNDYLKEINYANSPFIVYRHDDTRHKHVHVIVSHVDWEGKKQEQYNIFLKSQKISRKLEEKYNLRSTSYNYTITNEDLNGKNARKYYFQTAIKKGLNAYNTKAFLEKNIPHEVINSLQKNTLTNDQVIVLLKDKSNAIHKFLEEKGMFNTLLKDEIFRKATDILNKSVDIKDYVKNLENEGIYIRKVFNNGKPEFIYGLKDSSFYIQDFKLGKKFTYSRLSGTVNQENNSKGNNYSFEQQKKYIKRMAIKNIAASNSLQEFSTKLNNDGIELITYQNSGGIYGIAYKSINADNAEIFKGSEIGVGWNDVKTYFEKNNRNEIGQSKPVINYSTPDYNYIPYIPGFFKGDKGREEDVYTKKKKNDRGNDREANSKF